MCHSRLLASLIGVTSPSLHTLALWGSSSSTAARLMAIRLGHFTTAGRLWHRKTSSAGRASKLARRGDGGGQRLPQVRVMAPFRLGPAATALLALCLISCAAAEKVRPRRRRAYCKTAEFKRQEPHCRRRGSGVASADRQPAPTLVLPLLPQREVYDCGEMALAFNDTSVDHILMMRSGYFNCTEENFPPGGAPRYLVHCIHLGHSNGSVWRSGLQQPDVHPHMRQPAAGGQQPDIVALASGTQSSRRRASVNFTAGRG